MVGDKMRVAARHGIELAVGDVRARLKFGRHAPLWCERVWIEPRECQRTLGRGGRRSLTDRVVGGDWDRRVHDVTSIARLRACLLRWRDGLPWEETGILEDAQRRLDQGRRPGGLDSLGAVRQRCRDLDTVFAQVGRERRLRTRAELSVMNLRERGGVRVVADRNRRPIFYGGGGCHRLAMALALELPVMPAQVMAVHVEAEGWRERLHAGASAPPTLEA